VLVDNAPDRMMVHVAGWGGENIADCGTFAECNPADAYLIASAPDLYEALRDLLRQVDDLDAYSCADVHDAARAAIARAEGR